MADTLNWKQMIDQDPAVAEKLKALAIAATEPDFLQAMPALNQFTQALKLPLRQALLVGDTVTDIFEHTYFAPGTQTRMPLDFYTPGQEGEHIAYTIPKVGSMPTKQVEGDYVILPTYEIGNGISAPKRYIRDARWDVVGRMMQVMQTGVRKKINDDGWHTILAAGVDRNILTFDSDAAAGLFTKRLVSLLQTIAKRNGGGNSSSMEHGRITDLYISPEAFEDIRNWNVDQIDEVTRKQIFDMQDGTLSRIFGVNLHELYELGETQEYQTYYTDQLSGSLGSDLELVVGLNLSGHTGFVMPVIEELDTYPDQRLFYERKVGWLCNMELGFACLDNRSVLLGSF